VRIAVTGARGQLGHALLEAIESAGHEAIALGRDTLEILDPGAEDVVAGLGAQWIVHGAAYTAVDQAESEPELAHRVNVEGSRAVARGAERAGAHLLYVSTDYVFGGSSVAPWAPWEPGDPTEPVNVYGRTKLEGEAAVGEAHSDPLTVRTSWLMGGQGPNFAAAMLGLARSERELSVVDDQRGRPTWVFDLAPALVRLMEVGARGLVHVANEGEATWFEVAAALFEAARGQGEDLGDLALRPTTTGAYGAPAPRPAYSVLDTRDTYLNYGVARPHWREGLTRALENCP
jgi:dTDP-4-dehydrorhamnose reductase